MRDWFQRRRDEWRESAADFAVLVALLLIAEWVILSGWGAWIF